MSREVITSLGGCAIRQWLPMGRANKTPTVSLMLDVSPEVDPSAWAISAELVSLGLLGGVKVKPLGRVNPQIGRYRLCCQNTTHYRALCDLIGGEKLSSEPWLAHSGRTVPEAIAAQWYADICSRTDFIRYRPGPPPGDTLRLRVGLTLIAERMPAEEACGVRVCQRWRARQEHVIDTHHSDDENWHGAVSREAAVAHAAVAARVQMTMIWREPETLHHQLSALLGVYLLDAWATDESARPQIAQSYRNGLNGYVLAPNRSAVRS